MSKKVTAVAKQTLHGSYGLASAGDTIVLDERHAKQLEEKGFIEIVGDTGEEEVKEKKEGSFAIRDNTGAAKEKAEDETDVTNPVGKEKADATGPNKRKTK